MNFPSLQEYNIQKSNLNVLIIYSKWDYTSSFNLQHEHKILKFTLLFLNGEFFRSLFGKS